MHTQPTVWLTEAYHYLLINLNGVDKKRRRRDHIVRNTNNLPNLFTNHALKQRGQSNR